MTLQGLFAKLDQESDRQGDYFFDPLPIAEQAIREAIEIARATTEEQNSKGLYPFKIDAIQGLKDNLCKEFGIEPYAQQGRVEGDA